MHGCQLFMCAVKYNYSKQTESAGLVDHTLPILDPLLAQLMHTMHNTCNLWIEQLFVLYSTDGLHVTSA